MKPFPPPWGALLPLVAAAFLFAAGLEHWPLWGDEQWTWALLALSFSDMLQKVAGDLHPPGYYTLVWTLLDDTARDGLLRLPSALGALGVVAIAGATGRRWFGELEGTVAGFALALSPFLVVYAGIARGYALLACVAGALLLAGAELVSGARIRGAAVALALSGATAIYIHYAAGAAIVATALGVAAGLWARPDRGAGRWAWGIGAFAAMGLLFLPWAVGAMVSQELGPQEVQRSLKALGYLGWPVGPYQPVANWGMLAVAALGIVPLVRRRRPVDRLLGAWAACALLIPLVLSSRGDLQAKYYVQSWFLPAWALLVGGGVSLLLARVPGPRQLWALGAGVVFAMVFAGPLCFLWGLPAGPFGLKKGNTAYDGRIDLRLFSEVLPAGPVPATDFHGAFVYERYGRPVIDRARQNGWTFGFREEERGIRSVYASLDGAPCTFAYAFVQPVLVPDPAQCTALRARITEIARDDGYPPFLLQLAADARAEGRLVDAERLGREALAGGAPIGWSDPAVFLAQFHTQNEGYTEALAVADAALRVSLAWQNRYAVAELYGIRGEILRATNRMEEAFASERCASAESPPSCMTP